MTRMLVALLTASEDVEELEVEVLGLVDADEEAEPVDVAEDDDELVSDAELDSDLEVVEDAAVLELEAHGRRMLEAAPESSAHARNPSKTATSRTTKYGMVLAARERVPR